MQFRNLNQFKVELSIQLFAQKKCKKRINYSSLLTRSKEKAGVHIAIYSHSSSKGFEY